MNSSTRRNLLEAVRYAMMAPSLYNSQPWKFKLGIDSVRIYPDMNRHLPYSDPNCRNLYISMGCAFENLKIALEHRGFLLQGCTSLQSKEYLELRLTDNPLLPIQKEDLSKMYDCIPKRRSLLPQNLEAQPIPGGSIAELNRLHLESGSQFEWIQGKEELYLLSKLVETGQKMKLSHPQFKNEYLNWGRFGVHDFLNRKDGVLLYPMAILPCLGWLVKAVATQVNLAKLRSEQAKTRIYKASSAVVFTSEGDSKEDWVRIGRTFQRFVLKAASLGIQYAHLNPVVEVPELRCEVQEKFVRSRKFPQIIIAVSLGEIKFMNPVRRPVQDVILENMDLLFSRPFPTI